MGNYTDLISSSVFDDVLQNFEKKNCDALIAGMAGVINKFERK